VQQQQQIHEDTTGTVQHHHQQQRRTLMSSPLSFRISRPKYTPSTVQQQQQIHEDTTGTVQQQQQLSHLDVLSLVLEDLQAKVDGSVAGGLGADVAASPLHTAGAQGAGRRGSSSTDMTAMSALRCYNIKCCMQICHTEPAGVQEQQAQCNKHTLLKPACMLPHQQTSTVSDFHTVCQQPGQQQPLTPCR
jgi:hypothetical protein